VYLGLTNSLATFQMMMNDILQDSILSGDVMAYLDDILIAHSNLAHHCEIIWEVLFWLRENWLLLHPEKCKFKKLTIKYLGPIISHNHVEMDPIKVTRVAVWPAPKKRKDVQQFLDLMNLSLGCTGRRQTAPTELPELSCCNRPLTENGAPFLSTPRA
jgi:hypothetical protein